MGGPPSTGVEIPSESAGAAIREGSRGKFVLEWLRKAAAEVSEDTMIFNNEQVTCVGAPVMVKP